MCSSPARPDLAAYSNATHLSVPSLVSELRNLLGAKLVAYFGGGGETRAVRQWSEGTRHVSSSDDVQRLRLAYQVAQLLAERERPAGVQAWFLGLNPDLDDRSPARLLKEGNVDDVGPQILAAARKFAANG